MIEVLLNKPEFEYDIHSLIKAFFPEQYVGVSAEKKEYDEKIDIRMQVNYGEDTIQITWQEIVHANEDAQANEKPGQEEVKEIPGETIQVDFSDRVRTKNQLKQMLYRMLCDYTKRTLPWGNLTGIRPTKIPMKLLEEGKSREEIYRYMKDTYLASDEKIELATDIAERENAILKKIDYDNGYSLYIGIPFCPTTCLYCSFTSYPLVSWKNRVDAYLDALEREIDYTAAKFYHKNLNSIYIGGGTPTTLEPYQLDRLIRKIKCSFDLSDCLEFTVEAGRPDSITREKLEVLRKWGITRISINPQTMQQRTLDLIGRHHSVEQTVESFKIARELGFDIVPYIRVYKENQNLEELINLLKEKAAYLSYPIDGLVAAYNDIAYGLSLGVTDKYPRHSLAYKFYDDEYETVLTDIEWTMGKSGQLTPTAVFEPVDIDGTSVSRASLHNVSIFKGFYLHKDDTVSVYKANQIIPQISQNITRGYNTGEKFIIPKICPICGEPVSVVKENDSEVLMCMNAGCKGKLLGELNAFVGKKAHDINGLSEATLQLLIDTGLVTSPIDLYYLKDHSTELSRLPRMGAKKIANILDSIESSRNTTIEKFIVGLNIPLIGGRAAKDIARYEEIRTRELGMLYPFETFIKDAASDFNFTCIEGLGTERNISIHRYFKENYDYVIALAEQFIFSKLNNDKISSESDSLSGKKFCITGKLHIFANRDELVADIESKGGKVVSGVTKATDYLITNDKNSGSSKNKKASELNIPIISEEEYKNKLN